MPKNGEQTENPKRRKGKGAESSNLRLPQTSKTPDKPAHPKRHLGIDFLFFLLRPGCFLQEAELPVTVEFTTEGFRTTVTFERVPQRPHSGQIRGGIYGPAQKN